MIKKIADIFLSTYLFIATASAGLLLTTYLLIGEMLKINGLALLVFFSTLLVYNFHKVSSFITANPFSLRGLLPLKKISKLTKLMIIIALIGTLCSSAFVHLKTLCLLFPLALITVAYSIPVLKVNGKRTRLREIFLVKITTLALIWCFTTVTLPVIDSGASVFSQSSILLFIERFLFMFAICIPFEIRDMDQEKKWGVTTLPQRIGETWCKVLGLSALLAFMVLVYFQYSSFTDHQQFIFTLPLCISAMVAACLVWFSNRQRSKYYFRIFIDGTMLLQFILLILFKSIR